MWTVFDANLIPILIGLLIGILTGWWIFKRARSGSPAVTHPGSPTPDTEEGDGVADQAAAAISDVAGEILGTDAHAELPGASGSPDNLQTLKGVGPKLADQLAANGITRFDQLAALNASQVDMLDNRLGAFKGRVGRDRLVEQASYLARGDTSGFEATFGKFGSGPS